MKKIVNLPIEVPDSDYCWDGKVSCYYFDNTGGHGVCELNIGDIERCKSSCGYKKPAECLKLKAIEEKAKFNIYLCELWDRYDDSEFLLITAETESVALGLALEYFPESTKNRWHVTEVDLSEIRKVEDIKEI